MSEITPLLPHIYNFWAAQHKHANPKANQNLEGLEVWFKKAADSNESFRYSRRLFSTVGAAKNSFSRDLRWSIYCNSPITKAFPNVRLLDNVDEIRQYFYTQLSFLPSNILQKADGKALIRNQIEMAIAETDKYKANHILTNILTTYLQ